MTESPTENTPPEIVSLEMEINGNNNGSGSSILNVTIQVKDVDGTEDIVACRARLFEEVGRESVLMLEMQMDEMESMVISPDMLLLRFLVDDRNVTEHGTYRIEVSAADSGGDSSSEVNLEFVVTEETGGSDSTSTPAVSIALVAGSGLVLFLSIYIGYFYGLHTGYFARAACCPACSESVRYIRKYRDYYCYECSKYVGDMTGR